MRGAVAQRIGSRWARLMRCGCAFTHPTGACSICQLSLRPFRSAPALRATNKPTNQQTRGRAALPPSLDAVAGQVLVAQQAAEFGQGDAAGVAVDEGSAAVVLDR